ncbi:MAG: zinc-ribbon domain-containing protein, partial [Bacillota bacterium]
GAVMEDFYCPECFGKLERLSGCGAVGYMCNSCKHLISRQKMLSKELMEEAKQNRQNKKNPEE